MCNSLNGDCFIQITNMSMEDSLDLIDDLEQNNNAQDADAPLDPDTPDPDNQIIEEPQHNFPFTFEENEKLSNLNCSDGIVIKADCDSEYWISPNSLLTTFLSWFNEHTQCDSCTNLHFYINSNSSRMADQCTDMDQRPFCCGGRASKVNLNVFGM